MHIVQILLPLTDNNDQPQPADQFASVRQALTEKFGGLTAYTHSPAEGLWKSDDGTDRDQVVIFEIMADGIDKEWWSAYRAELEDIFRQDEIVIRAHAIELL